ncbi:fibronectin type III domain-containing protein [Streptomyces sp. A3M-1-3]|uniref:fibronectin type III domain-containing protein n=1 Tax=Streptomyces sp. A3M-1-3 TaxID=2962044 RepID=UPI0020B656CF|nr:fibronectin type III domain-containing protein [Streptomyces sp. A3M-1-3]MCP3819740.1 fibronectin type III domain-containing protein [Streptomyces sp. A3M-1-3]
MRLRRVTTKIAGAACATACLTTTAIVTAPGSAAAEGPTTLTADPLPTWQTNGTVWSVAHARGVVYVGGSFTSVRPPGAPLGQKETPRANFAAFNAVTGALLPCAPSFTGGAGSVRALKASLDGSVLYAGGSFNKANSAHVANAVALNTAGCTLRGDFKPAVSGSVRAIDVTAKTVYLGGDFTVVGGQSRNRIAAVSTSGALLPFKATLDKPVRAITVAEKHGKVIVGGDFTTVNGLWSKAVAALNPSTGSTVQRYPGWFKNASVVKALAHDGTHFFMGAEGTGPGAFDGRIAAHLDTGEMLWKDNCFGATQAVLPYKGVLYSGSHAHNCAATPGGFPEHNNRQHFLANSIADKTILHWFPDTNEGGPVGPKWFGPRSMVMAKDILWVGGDFTTVNDAPQQALTRFPAAPDTGAPMVPQLAVANTSATRITLGWRASWDRDDADLTYRIYRDGVLVKSLTQRSTSWARPLMSFTDSVAQGARHRYSIRVTDGGNTSPHSASVTATAAQTRTAGTP